jgi:hypothetical protein
MCKKSIQVEASRGQKEIPVSGTVPVHFLVVVDRLDCQSYHRTFGPLFGRSFSHQDTGGEYFEGSNTWHIHASCHVACFVSCEWTGSIFVFLRC